ncbi:MAG: hypothetical protein Q7T83_05785 [Thermodesulfovibrionales bacterium]|nr:hypothetical protein [Thermodesulfovibrionales bacterium]
MTNRDRRKLVGGIFADTAKYSLTAGVIGSIISKDFSVGIGILLGVVAFSMGVLAYFVTPKNKEKEG